MQTPIESFIETTINVLIGLMVSFAAQVYIFPKFDIHVPMSTNLALCGFFTVVSIVRSYIVRRIFNARIKQIAHKFG